MRHVSTIFAVLLLLAGPVMADNAREIAVPGIDPPPPSPPVPGPLFVMPTEVLYDNGPLVNSPGTGYGGADESMLQTTLGMNTLGFGHQVYYGYMIADDFEVPAGETWDVEQITFFAYQTSSPTSPSPITAVHFEVWDGPPGAGGSTIFGDMVTNRMVGSAWSGIYRVSSTTSGATNRPIMADVCSPMGILQLTGGTYWLVWQTDGTLSSGPWAPPITINGMTTTGNGLQYTTAWNPALDSGTSTQQGFPFIIEGTRGPIGVEPSTWSTVKALYR